MSKRKRKRLFPRHMSAHYISTSRIDPNKASAYNAQRTRATRGSRGDTEHDPNSGFMQELPPEPFTRYGKKYYKPDDGGYFKSQRGLVLERKHELLILESKDLFGLYRVWQNGRYKQGVSTFYCQYLEGNRNTDRKIMLFFCVNDCLIISEYDGHRSISKTYQGRDKILSRYKNNNIAWVVWREPISNNS